LLDFYWIGLDFWVQSNIIGFLTLNVDWKSSVFGFLELALVGCSIESSIQSKIQKKLTSLYWSNS
jgi:hypothetical protein